MTDIFGIEAPVKPLSKRIPKENKLLLAKEKKTAKEKQKIDDVQIAWEREQRKKPVIRHMIHKPTYCVLTHHNIFDEPIPHDRHTLSAFKSKTETFSNLSVSRMKTALNWLYLFADKKRVHSKKPWINSKGKICHDFTFRLAFITLTLTQKQKHSDDEIKEKLLKPFLHWLTRAYTASYVWKAETQLNGNIHFHITIDTFIHWKSIRAKWNSLLQTQGYVKCFQDGSNDKGDAATQIKAIRNEKGHAGIVGGYLTKGSIEEKEHYRLSKKQITIDELIQHSEGVSCEWKTKKEHEYEISKGASDFYCSLKPKKHYTRFVNGRLWSQSQSLSNINVSFSDIDPNFQTDERSFFHDNEVKNLGKILLEEQKEKYKKLSESEKTILGYDDISLKKKYSKYFNVFIHANLKSLRIPPELSKIIAKEKENRNLNTQRCFTVESLF